MNNPTVSNPNDFKVVAFHNSTEFGFTPDMGCMYDGRPINGRTGAPGIDAGETVTLPYHIGHRLAVNLAKIAMIRGVAETKPQLDANGQPIVAALWDEVKLEALKNSYLKELYTEEKPVAMSETDKLMAKVEEYKKMVEQLLPKKVEENPPQQTQDEAQISHQNVENPKVSESQAQSPVYQDKKDVIAELEKRQIPHDKRKNKADLEKLLS